MPRRHGFARCSLALALLAASLSAYADVFVNELHYDNDGADLGEAIEVVASAGESLAGYRIHLYNGSNPGAATVYADDAVPAGALASCGGDVRIATVSYPANGLQNGGPDGLALVAPDGGVVQFLSYEGSMTAANGPAAGLASTDIGVAEAGNAAAGTSLQLAGTGSVAADFTWAGSANATFGSCNNDQAFGAPGNAAPAVVSTVPADGASGFPASGELQVVFSEPVSVQPGAFALACSAMRKHPIALEHAAEGVTFTLTPGKPLMGGEQCTLTVDATRIADQDGDAPEADTTVAFTVKRGDGGGGAYYGRVNTSSPDQLRCSLHHTIRGHTAYPYSGSGTSTWTILEIADEDPNDAARILDVYRNRTYAKGSDRAGTGSGITYNREHTWPNSLGFGSATGDLGLPHAPYTDTHMLYLSDTGYNSDRGNMPYADCTAGGCGERPTEAYDGRGGGSGVYPGNSNWVQGPNGNQGSFQAWSARKGDLARAVLYMAIRYEGGTHPVHGQSEPDLELTDDRSLIVATSASPAYMGLLSTLLDWHQADPPDAAEQARNEVVFSFQGNRNPFIDHPEWATQALFASSQPATCDLASSAPRNPKLRRP